MLQLRHNSTELRKHITLSTRKALLGSAAVAVLGVWLSVDQNNWSWFARSGSIIVIIGIFLTSSQIIENSRKLRARRYHRDHNFHRDFAEDLKRDTLERSRILDEDIWENGLQGLYLLIIGTLIWGFGDLAGHLI